MSSIRYFESLPLKLKQFFAKYPPGQSRYASHPTDITSVKANPFLGNRNPITGKYNDPIYSRRRMSGIVKLASNHGVEDLLPPWRSIKLFRQEKYDQKKFMKGVMWPKLHRHEREPRVIKTQEEIDEIMANHKPKSKAKRTKTWV